MTNFGTRHTKKFFTTGSPTLGADPPQSFFSPGRQTPASQRPDQQPPWSSHLGGPAQRGRRGFARAREPQSCNSRGEPRDLRPPPIFITTPLKLSPLAAIAIGLHRARLPAHAPQLSSQACFCFRSLLTPAARFDWSPLLGDLATPPLLFIGGLFASSSFEEVCLFTCPAAKGSRLAVFMVTDGFLVCFIIPPIVVIVLLYHSCCFLLLLAPCKRPPQFWGWGLLFIGST
jgi:hypothetical protein